MNVKTISLEEAVFQFKLPAENSELNLKENPHLIPVYLFLKFEKEGLFNSDDAEAFRLGWPWNKDNMDNDIVCRGKFSLPEGYQSWFLLHKSFETGLSITFLVGEGSVYSALKRGSYVSYASAVFAGDREQHQNDFDVKLSSTHLETAEACESIHKKILSVVREYTTDI